MSAAVTSMPQGTVAADPLRLLSVKDLAAVFGVGEHAIRKRIRLRQLGPVIRRGKAYVMRAEVLRRYFEDAEREWESESRGAGRPERRPVS
jgi:hypothetical protein